MRQAITTKYHGPSNVRGARISATAQAGRIYMPYQHQYNPETNHLLAAQRLAEKLNWHGTWVSGWNADESGVHVLVDGGDVSFTAHRPSARIERISPVFGEA